MHASVIIPAHNEEQVIGRLLTALTSANAALPEIIVVCNGCKDKTADVARQFAPAVTVIETDVPSKVNALNLGDAAAHQFPRIYVDADVVIQPDSLAAIISTLSQSGASAAAPTPVLNLRGASRAVRRFYAVDQIMPSHAGGIGGSGVYALTEAGRRCFDNFPKIIADDAFVRRHFKEGERVVVAGAQSLVTPPATLAGLITIKTRSHLGNIEIGRKFPNLSVNKGRGNHTALLRLAMGPQWWPSLATYIYVKLKARYRARRQAARMFNDGGPDPAWERDDTSRASSPVVV